MPLRGKLPGGRMRARYIDLLKRSVLGETYSDNLLRIWYLKKCVWDGSGFDRETFYDIRSYAPEITAQYLDSIEKGMPFLGDVNSLALSHTMLGRKRIDNIERCVRRVLVDGVPGDLIECGVWRGGAVVFMRGLLEAFEARDRIVWVADSFEGLPPATASPDVEANVSLTRESAPALAIDLDTVKRAFEGHGLLDDQVRFLKGWFKETLPDAPIEQLAILRVDGDMYGSTMDVLENLYDKVVPGGFVIIDDYFVPYCKQAVDDFRAARGVPEPIRRVDWTGIFWRKEA